MTAWIRLGLRVGRAARIAAAAGLALAGLAVGAGAAPTSVVVTYDVSYSGLVSLEVGRVTLQLSAAGPAYQLSLAFRPSASAKSFAVGQASARASGMITPRGLSPALVMLDYGVRGLAETRSFSFSGDRLQDVRVTKKKSGGLFKDVRTLAYDPRQLPALAPLAEAEQHNLLDPLSALFLPLNASAVTDRQNCARRLRVYDGRRRFDLALAFAGVEAAAVPGAGEAIVCSVRYLPIAGQNLERDEFTEEMRDYRVAVALVQAPGLNLLVPSRITFMDASGQTVAQARAVAIAGR